MTPRRPAPSPTDHKKTADQLDEALVLLDHELTSLRLAEPVQIRAIGGYALMKHGIRAQERALTLDIDTVTRTYQQAVLDAIERVAAQLDLDSN